MTPLAVTAVLRGQVSLPHGPLALDALLASQVALRLGLPPPRHAGECVDLEIPIQKEPGGSFHLASFGVGDFEQHEIRYVNRRAPVDQYQTLGSGRIRRVQITAGANKSYRIPLEVGHLSGDFLRWYCVGDATRIRDLLSTVTHLGRRRAVGLGRVGSWSVEPCETWDGFPVVSPSGKPLRTLPPDWPGLVEPQLGYRTLTMPYWDHSREELCAVAV